MARNAFYGKDFLAGREVFYSQASVGTAIKIKGNIRSIGGFFYVFGGAGETSVPEVLKAQKGECDRRDQYIEFDLPAYGALIFEFSL